MPGAIEAKAEGTLTGVEAQSAKYAQGVSEDLPVYHIPLPFLFESNGSVTCFTNGFDPTERRRLASKGDEERWPREFDDPTFSRKVLGLEEEE